MSSDLFFTCSEAAEYIGGVKAVTIRSWISKKILPAEKIEGSNRWKILQSDLDRLSGKLRNTVACYAARTDRHPESVRESLRRGTLQGHKEGGVWYVDA